MGFGHRIARRSCRTGSLKTEAKEVAKNGLHLLGVQEVGCEARGSIAVEALCFRPKGRGFETR
jgi:hypothetical protein